jgi:hypothetical protein
MNGKKIPIHYACTMAALSASLMAGTEKQGKAQRVASILYQNFCAACTNGEHVSHIVRSFWLGLIKWRRGRKTEISGAVYLGTLDDPG